MRTLLAVVAGVIVGSAVNMGIVMVGPSIIPMPPGIDPSDPESIKASIHLFEAQHFIVPFLAHALGTLIGALVAFVVAETYQLRSAYIIGAVFFIGGIWASTMIPAPTWFIVADLVIAYIPMAWLATKIGSRLGQESTD
jgi:hypothetical protein